MERYLPTGNAFLSLPKMNEQTAGIEDLTFLSMQHKGMIEIRGGEELPLIRPFLQADGHRLPLTQMQWSRDSFWLPVLKGKAGAFDFTMTILTPIEERGFAVRMELTGTELELLG